jgi:outer membrane receptor for ferrienterochelin and colicin
VNLTEEEAGVATSTQRPLAGQSPYVANLSLGFAPPETGFEAFLHYNVFGRRLAEVGRLGIPDIYEEPFHSLDLVARYELSDHLSLKAAVRNLLLQRSVLDQGGIAVREYEPGLSASIQVGWSN